MTKNKILVILLIVIVNISTFVSVSSADIEKTYIKAMNDDDNYVIEGVPYAQKNKRLSCDYAPIEMVFRYYGVNITQYEIVYFSGGGYSQGYGIPLKRVFEMPPRKLPFRFACLGDLLVGGADDYKFLANLHGLSFEMIFPDYVISHGKIWNEYWEKVKNNVKNDIPIITALDPLAWPPYRNWTNMAGCCPPLLGRSCCITVVVGYNESNGTVCVNEQYIGHEKGHYLWVNLEDFRTAVKRAYFYIREARYSMYIIKKVSDPLPREMIYDLVHERNIQKMKGIKSAYDSRYIQDNFKEFGINALKALREDLSSKFIRWVPAYNMINKVIQKIDPSHPYPFTSMINYFGDEASSKNMTSKLLIENMNVSSYHEKDALLLEIEAKHWEKLTILTEELKEAVINNTLIKSIHLSKPIINNMVNTVDDIISVEKMIIT